MTCDGKRNFNKPVQRYFIYPKLHKPSHLIQTFIAWHFFPIRSGSLLMIVYNNTKALQLFIKVTNTIYKSYYKCQMRLFV